MRVAVRPTGDVGRRAVHVLLADPSVEVVGVLGTQPSHTAGGRLQAAASEDGWDILVLDTDPGLGSIPIPLIATATPGVVASRCPGEDRRRDTASVSTGAWTEPGSPLTAGTRVRFPDPVGALLAGPIEKPEEAPPGDYMLAPGAPEPWIGLSLSVNGEGPAGGWRSSSMSNSCAG